MIFLIFTGKDMLFKTLHAPVKHKKEYFFYQLPHEFLAKRYGWVCMIILVFTRNGMPFKALYAPVKHTKQKDHFFYQLPHEFLGKSLFSSLRRSVFLQISCNILIIRDQVGHYSPAAGW